MSYRYSASDSSSKSSPRVPTALADDADLSAVDVAQFVVHASPVPSGPCP
jgi:hypothetical protein